MATDTASWVGRVLAGRYRVLARLGEGGMAYVYRARDDRLGGDVVIKAPRRSILEEPDFAGRFAREVRSLVRLVHPHIVKALDIGEEVGVPFAVLQYLAGGGLRARQPQGPDGKPLALRPGELRGWLAGVAAALDFIHQRGYIHRDVKPDNILFDEHGHAYLSDFGIVKALAGGRTARQTVLTATGVVLGTPPYMAPELTLGERCDGRVDQYGLAVTVYELLSGRVPFDGPTPAAVVMQQMTQPPPLLDATLPAVPKGVAAAVQRALHRDPRQRYPDCAAFARAVLAEAQAAPLQPETVPSVQGERATPEETSTASCPACRKTFNVRRSAQGKSVRCPSCKTVFRAPAWAIPLGPQGGSSGTGWAVPVGQLIANRETGRGVPEKAPTQRATLAAAASPAAGGRWKVRLAVVAGTVLALLLVVMLATVWLVSVRGTRGTVAHAGDAARDVQAHAPAAADAEAVEGSIAPVLPPAEDARPAGAPPPPPAPTPASLRLLSIPDVTLKPGERKTIEVRVERRGCKDPIRLQAEGLPLRIGAMPSSIAANQDRATLELIAAADAQEAASTATVHASAGNLSEEATMTVTVRIPVPTVPDKPSARPKDTDTGERVQGQPESRPRGTRPATPPSATAPTQYDEKGNPKPQPKLPRRGTPARAYASPILQNTVATQDFFEKSGVQGRSEPFLGNAQLGRMRLQQRQR
jgi:serine/threonine protein kinase